MVTRKTSKKSRQREQLIVALLQQPTLVKAAASIGISSVTAWRVSKTPESEAEYRKARREVYAETMARAQQASGAAVTTLLKVMVDQNAPAASRVRAADCVLDLAAKTMEFEDLEVRVSDLEQAVELSKRGDLA